MVNRPGAGRAVSGALSSLRLGEYDPPLFNRSRGRVSAVLHRPRLDQPDRRRFLQCAGAALLLPLGAAWARAPERRALSFVHTHTGEQLSSVYFEAGYAEGLGIPVIWTCHADEEKKGLSFDTRQNEHLLWTTPEQLRSELVARIDRRGWRLT